MKSSWFYSLDFYIKTTLSEFHSSCYKFNKNKENKKFSCKVCFKILKTLVTAKFQLVRISKKSSQKAP